MSQPTIVCKDGKLVLTIDLKEKGRLSKSEKSLTIASSNGNMAMAGEGVPSGLKFGFNAFVPNPEYVKPSTS